VPKNRNTRDENKQIKEDKTPEGWDEQPNMRRQKDEHARWTKKHGKSHYICKNHVSIDKEYKLYPTLCGHGRQCARQPTVRRVDR